MLSTPELSDKGDRPYRRLPARSAAAICGSRTATSCRWPTRFGTPTLRHIESATARELPDAPNGIRAVLDADPSSSCRRSRRTTCSRCAKLLNEEGVGCDVFGANELRRALRAGVPADAHLRQRLGEESELLRAAVLGGRQHHARQCAGAGIDLLSITTELDKTARMRLRMRPDHAPLTEGSDFFPGMAIRDAAQLYKPGIEPSAARAIGRRALSHGRIELTGLMTHLGRHSADPAVWAEDGGGLRGDGG